METLDHQTDPSKQWGTNKAIDSKPPPKPETEAITFDYSQVSSPKQIANYFNRQFTTWRLGIHPSSRETRLVLKNGNRWCQGWHSQWNYKGISNCSNTKAFGHDKLSIFHLKNLGLKAIEYITAFYNDSVTSCRIPAIWKSSIVVPIPKPDSSLGTSYQQRKLWMLLCLLLPTHTCSKLLTNTDYDLDIQPLLLYYTWRVMSRQASIKGNCHIEWSVVLLTQRRHSIQSTITYCYQRLQDQHFLMQPVELHQRQTISYKLQRRQVKDNP